MQPPLLHGFPGRDAGIAVWSDWSGFHSKDTIPTIGKILIHIDEANRATASERDVGAGYEEWRMNFFDNDVVLFKGKEEWHGTNRWPLCPTLEKMKLMNSTGLYSVRFEEEDLEQEGLEGEGHEEETIEEEAT